MDLNLDNYIAEGIGGKQDYERIGFDVNNRLQRLINLYKGNIYKAKQALRFEIANLTPEEAFTEIINQYKLRIKSFISDDNIEIVKQFINRIPNLKYYNPLGVVFAYEYYVLQSKNMKDNIENLFNEAKNFRINGFDIIRYYRKLSSIGILPVLKTINKFLLFDKKVNKECKKYEPLVVNKEKNEIYECFVQIDNRENITIKISEFDTIETLKIKIAEKESLPIIYVDIKEIKSDKTSIITIEKNDMKEEIIKGEKIDIKIISKIKEKNKKDTIIGKTYKIKTIKSFFILFQQIVNGGEKDGIEAWKELIERIKESEEFGNLSIVNNELELSCLYLILRFGINKQKVYNDQVFRALWNGYNKNIRLYLDIQTISNIIENREDNVKVFVENFFELKKYVVEISQKNLSYILEYPIDEKIKYSNLIQTSYTLKGEFKIESLDMFEIFNEMNVNITIPYIKGGKFYKILQNIEVPKEWLKKSIEHIKDVDSLSFYVLNKKEEREIKTLKIEDYNYVIINPYYTEKGINTFSISIENKDSQIEKIILERIMNVLSYLSNSIYDFNLEREFERGIFIYKGMLIDENIMYDYAMNDKYFSEYLNINEKLTIHRQKGGLKINITPTQFSEPIIECIITYKEIKIASDDELSMFPNDVMIGDKIYVVKVKGEISEYEVDKYKDIFLRCISYMMNTYKNNFINWYCQYIGDIEYNKIDIENIKLEKKKDVRAKDINPDLFISDYTRSCSHAPSIFPLEDENKLIEDNIDYMIFPKDNKGPKQYLYACIEHPRHKYIGLTQNTITNKTHQEKYPLIPCCRTTPQNVEGTERWSYENDIKIKKREIKTPELSSIKRSLLKTGQYGYLPNRLQTMLQMLDNDVLLGNSNIRRLGVSQKGTSIIDCIAKATETIIEKNEIIDQLEHLIYIGMISQSGLSYNEGMDILNKWKRGENIYINPEVWINALEILYQVNIIILTSNKTDNISGSFLHPLFYRFLIINPQINNYDHTVLIYTHNGGEFDNPDYPQSELIVKRDNISSDIQYLFSNDKKIIKYLRKLYIDSIVSITQSFNIKAKILKQYIDGYGKIRKFIVNYANYIFPIETDPVAPIEILDNKFNDNNIEYPPQSIAINFLELHKAKDIKQVVNMNTYQGIIGNIKDVNVFIRISSDYELEEKLDNYESSRNPIRPIVQKSFNLLKQYSLYSRISNYLLSYLFVLFVSSTNYTTKINDDGSVVEDMCRKFADEYILINPDIKYEKLQLKRLIDLNDSPVISNGKLVVLNNNIKERMIYQLYLSVKFNTSGLSEYKYIKYIPNFYNNSSDFTSKSHYNVYNNIDDYLIYKKSKKPKYQTYINLFISKIPYFFYSEIDNKTYLCTPASSLKNALYISHYYNKYNIIPKNKMDEIDINSYILYTQSGNDIKKYYIGEIDESNIEENMIGLIKKDKKLYYFSIVNYSI